ncbi:hypothetical protein FOZ63_007117, partial [Perkinsus olseni]
GMKAGSYAPFITLLLILLISMLWLLYRVKYKRRLKDALHTRTATINTRKNILGSLMKDTAVYLGSKAMHHVRYISSYLLYFVRSTFIKQPTDTVDEEMEPTGKQHDDDAIQHDDDDDDAIQHDDAQGDVVA